MKIRKGERPEAGSTAALIECGPRPSGCRVSIPPAFRPGRGLDARDRSRYYSGRGRSTGPKTILNLCKVWKSTRCRGEATRFCSDREPSWDKLNRESGAKATKPRRESVEPESLPRSVESSPHGPARYEVYVPVAAPAPRQPGAPAPAPAARRRSARPAAPWCSQSSTRISPRRGAAEAWICRTKVISLAQA
jgi:hypothetical protein